MREGQIVFNQGYEFIATGITVVNHGRFSVAYYTGTCTDNRRNDSIRRTGYNGGRYSKVLAKGAV